MWWEELAAHASQDRCRCQNAVEVVAGYGFEDFVPADGLRSDVGMLVGSAALSGMVEHLAVR
jgi:hypothetical protein